MFVIGRKLRGNVASNVNQEFRHVPLKNHVRCDGRSRIIYFSRGFFCNQRFKKKNKNKRQERLFYFKKREIQHVLFCIRQYKQSAVVRFNNYMY